MDTYPVVPDQVSSREAWLALRTYVSRWRIATGKPASASILVCVDNANAFTSGIFADSCKQRDWILRPRVPNVARTHGFCEKIQGLIAARARTALRQSNLGSCDWFLSVVYACYMYNRIPSRKLPSPFTARFGVPPDIRDLRVFRNLSHDQNVPDDQWTFDERGSSPACHFCWLS